MAEPYKPWIDPLLSPVDQALGLIKVIQLDIDNEAHALDGDLFTGHSVAKRFGELMAEVHALSMIIEAMLQREKAR